MTSVPVSAPVLAWAQRRSGRDVSALRKKFAKWDEWLSGTSQPSLTQISKLADYTHVPMGYLFLPEPPVEELPITDFRAGRAGTVEASADLLDTIYQSQRRQAWFEDYLRAEGESEVLAFVGSARNLGVADAATLISQSLSFSVSERAQCKGAAEARAHVVRVFEDLGGLAVINSMVGNDTHRMLDLDEFRGFTVHSETAPLVFVNAADTKNGQLFSLIHELAHVWRGEGGVSAGGEAFTSRANSHERWCDAVAAEVLVPSDDLRDHFDAAVDLTRELEGLSKRYICSTLVVLLKLRELRLVPSKGFGEVYAAERDRVLELARKTKGGGGAFYASQPLRIGRKLSHAIIRDTNARRTSMTEALSLLGFKGIARFDSYAEYLGEA